MRSGNDELDSLIARVVQAARPAAVRERTRLLVLDTLGCALAGLQAPAVQTFVAIAARTDPGAVALPVCIGRAVAGEAAGVERAEQVSVPAAAQALAMAACWDEACEGLAVAHGRPGVPVVAAAASLAIAGGHTWGEVFQAVEVGYELGGRAGAWLRIRPGMHVDAGWPAVGAAAAVAHLLGGDAVAIRDAVELAATQLPFGLYLPVAQGADGRNTYLGHAASFGIQAALSAVAGVRAPRGALGAHREIALLGSSDMADLIAPPPERWLLLEGYLKRWPAVRHVHYGIAAARAIRAQMGLQDRSEPLAQVSLSSAPMPQRLAAHRVRRIRLRTYPEACTYCANRAPSTPIQAQFSLSFGLAVALCTGDLRPQDYRGPMFVDPDIRAIEGRVELVPEAGLGEGGRRCVVLELEDDRGQCWASQVDAVEGDPSDPLQRPAVLAKFERQTVPALGGSVASALAQAVDGPCGPDDTARVATVRAWWSRMEPSMPRERHPARGSA